MARKEAPYPFFGEPQNPVLGGRNKNVTQLTNIPPRRYMNTIGGCSGIPVWVTRAEPQPPTGIANNTPARKLTMPRHLR